MLTNVCERHYFMYSVFVTIVGMFLAAPLEGALIDLDLDLNLDL